MDQHFGWFLFIRASVKTLCNISELLTYRILDDLGLCDIYQWTLSESAIFCVDPLSVRGIHTVKLFQWICHHLSVSYISSGGGHSQNSVRTCISFFSPRRITTEIKKKYLWFLKQTIFHRPDEKSSLQCFFFPRYISFVFLSTTLLIVQTCLCQRCFLNIQCDLNFQKKSIILDINAVEIVFSVWYLFSVWTS